MISASIDGLTISSEAGSTFGLESLDGWYSSPPVKSVVEERPDQDGSFELEKFDRTARPIRLQGHIRAPEGDGSTEWRALAGLFGDGRPKTLTVTDELVTASCRVILAGTGVDVQPSVNGMADFSITMIAFDPVKYGPLKQEATGLPISGGGLEYPLHSPAGALFYGSNAVLGRVSVTNVGTASVSPRVRVTGGLAAGFEVVRLDTSQRLRYDRVVPDGTDVLIDCRTGAVLIDGTSDGSTYLTVADFFQAGPGETFDVQFLALGASSGTPTMTVEWSDGWW